MRHALNKIWIHAIWSTKYRAQLIDHTIEEQLYPFIAHQLQEQGCTVGIIHGMPDDMHCLFLLHAQKSIAEVLKQIKGSSSHFANHQNIMEQPFA